MNHTVGTRAVECVWDWGQHKFVSGSDPRNKAYAWLSFHPFLTSKLFTSKSTPFNYFNFYQLGFLVLPFNRSVKRHHKNIRFTREMVYVVSKERNQVSSSPMRTYTMRCVKLSCIIFH